MSKQLKDFLSGLSNAAEVELAIINALKEDGCKVFIDDGKENIYIPKKRLDAKIVELSGANEKITELNTTVTKLQGDLKGNESAQTTIKELQDNIKTYESKVKEIQIKNAIQLLATETKAKDVSGSDLFAFLDMSKVTIGANGEVTGAKEQVENLKKEKAYLFNDESEEGKPQKGLFDFLGTGQPGKPSNENTFGSKTIHSGDFGKNLAKQSSTSTQDNPVDSDYFFK